MFILLRSFKKVLSDVPKSLQGNGMDPPFLSSSVSGSYRSLGHRIYGSDRTGRYSLIPVIPPHLQNFSE
jgi:hypothetical protein